MSRTSHVESFRLHVVAVLLGVCLTGCDREPDDTYGALRGESLNGVSALVQLLRDSGRTTNTRTLLGPRMVGRHDVAIVFTDSFSAPGDDARGLLDRFLAAPGDQTVVFVIRDSDAAIDYWRAVAAHPGLAADKVATAQRNLAEADGNLKRAAMETVEAGAAPLDYALDNRPKPAPTPATVLGADSDGPPLLAHWPRARLFKPPPAARPLWTAGGEPLLVDRTRESGGGSSAPAYDRTLILASAAPLLNAGLLDSGNRRLAQAIVALLPAGCRVVVVGSARVRTEREEDDEPSTWRLLTIQPNPWVAAQALLAMILFCWWKAPIFGRPRREERGRPEEFGHHVDALAALLRRSGDDAFARGRVEAWRRSGDGRPAEAVEIEDRTQGRP